MSCSWLFGDFKAVIWRNWCLRKHQYFLTLLEFAIPIALYVILHVLKGKMIHNIDPKLRNTTIFSVQTGDEIITHSFLDFNLDLLYTPNTTFTNKVMKNVRNRLEQHHVQLDNFGSTVSETLLTQWFESKYGNQSMLMHHKGYGIVFEDIPPNGSAPQYFKYKIRSTQYELWDIGQLFPLYQQNGPMEAGRMYLTEGFIALQMVLDASYIAAVADNVTVNFSLQEFPYPPYEDNSHFKASDFYSNLLPMLTMFSWFFMGPILSKIVIEERRSGAKEYMKMVGMHSCFTWFSWIVYEMMIYIPVITILTIILVVPFDGNTILAYTNPLIIWLVLLIYFLGNTFFFLGGSLFFENPSIGPAVILMAWLVLQNLLTSVVDSGNLSFAFKFLTAFFPLTAFSWITKAIGGYETLKKELTFSNIFQMSSGQYQDMTVGLSLISSIIGIVLFILVIIYIDAVKPGKFGRAKPWYFPFKPFINLFSKNKTNCRPPINTLLENENCEIEDSPELREIGLSVINVSKHHGNVIAVDNLSIDIYHNQITALLGHNGAGKTTLLSIITGLFSPTDGDVYIGKQSVFENLNKFRKNIGFCPQHNLLFPFLSAMEHMILYGLLKDLSMSEAKSCGRNLLDIVGLKTKKNEVVKNLSGGMKRKLSLAISIIGNGKILILDEPTSGMDPESRREIWDILLHLRENRTIIITTHFMEEADVLGDRIAIMDHGKIKCYGSSLFLKKKYGTGYHLKIELENGNSSESICNVIHSCIPEATLSSYKGSVISFNLPTNQTAVFPKLFSSLEETEHLEIKGIGLSCTTMEDVFLRVCKECLEISNESKDFHDSISNKFRNRADSNELLTTTKLKGFHLFIQRFISLVMKKVIWSKKHWFATLFFVVIYPVLLALSVASTMEKLLDTNSISESLLLDLKTYGTTKVLVSGSEANGLSKSFRQIVYDDESVIKEINNTSIINGLLLEAITDEPKFRSSMIVAADFTNNTVLYSSIGIHAMPIAVNLYSNALLQSQSSSETSRIESYNQPFNFVTGLCVQNFSVVLGILSIIWALLVPMIYTFTVGYGIRFAHKERISSSKQLQFMTGLSPVTYWLSNFVVDYIQFLPSVVIIMFISEVYISFDIFSAYDNGVLLLVVTLFGIGAIWLAYVVSFFLQTYVNSFTIYTTISSILGICANLILTLLNDFIPSFLHYIFMINPFFALSSALFKIIPIILNNARCRSCENPDIKKQCKILDIIGTSFFKWDSTGINYELVFLVVSAAAYFIVVMLFEYGIFSMLQYRLISLYVGKVHYNEQLGDIHVEEEKNNVDLLDQGGSHGSEALVVNKLAKKFSRNFTAVHGVSFTISRGECFGLLGVNGAGKTTTFRMLTGDTFPTSGNAMMFGSSLQRNRKEYLSKIGYCPQTDAIVEELSGLQMLHLYARLRGIHPSQINSTAIKWISITGLEEVYNRPCGTYSGGNKRKLCVALALIGDPPFVFLDEPTTGVDPLSRQKLRDVLFQSKKQGQSIAITSHSMDECEALCDRLTIMVKGQMKCLGKILNLKQEYGQGYSLKIKLGVGDKEELKHSVSKTFPECFLKDEHFCLLDYHLNNPNYKLSELFASMEKLKTSHAIIEDYVISETTLEQVFLSFAKHET